jgi:CrcB protein
VTRLLLLIFIGGGCGSVLRFLVSGWMRPLGEAFPWGTLTVNVAGSMLIGLLAPLLSGPLLVRPEYRLAVLVGLLGGFTTFSSYSLETLSLMQDGQWRLAAANVVLSNTLGLAAAWLGMRLSILWYGG